MYITILLLTLIAVPFAFWTIRSWFFVRVPELETAVLFHNDSQTLPASWLLAATGSFPSLSAWAKASPPPPLPPTVNVSTPKPLAVFH